MPSPVVFSATVEGPTDEAILRRLVEYSGAELERVYGRSGKGFVLKNLSSYNSAARFRPWIVLVDLDRSAECAPAASAQWLPTPAERMCFRIAVREVESWLLADGEALAEYLGVKPARVPATPERLDDPKAAMVALARASRRRAIKTDMVPRPGSGRQVGPAYTSRLIEYAQGPWRPGVAAQHAEGLDRLLKRLTDEIDRCREGESR